MCTTRFRQKITPGGLAAYLFDRGDVRRCTTDSPDLAHLRLSASLTPEQHAAEVELARRALAEKLGEDAAIEAATAANPAALRSFRGALGIVRTHATQIAIARGIPAKDPRAVVAFTDSFAGALIDAADDLQYQARDAA